MNSSVNLLPTPRWKPTEQKPLVRPPHRPFPNHLPRASRYPPRNHRRVTTAPNVRRRLASVRTISRAAPNPAHLPTTKADAIAVIAAIVTAPPQRVVPAAVASVLAARPSPTPTSPTAANLL